MQGGDEPYIPEDGETLEELLCAPADGGSRAFAEDFREYLSGQAVPVSEGYGYGENPCFFRGNLAS